ncbi:hypothetical protein [Aldersonia kunmingensis]|uniref:hypothetical protein n=1 Tax=Aldersonia kunmingensis TaxID=408066 RepID=UPI000A9EDC34|nr:hypothetical protein [Aldersonia kunmingensis]
MEWDYYTSGGTIGIDPYIGNATWVSCSLYVDGVLWDSDYVTNGDGYDADCLYRP